MQKVFIMNFKDTYPAGVYINVTSGSTCERITSKAECEEAATQLGFADTQAQEESIARSSGIHNCQVKNIAFYENHRAMKSCVYTDSMIYSPKVPVFRKDNGELIEPILNYFKVC